MKYLLLILMLANTAEAYQCPDYMQTNPDAKKIHSWLRKFRDVQTLHNCKVEITFCETSDGFGEGSPLGEIFIETETGRQNYLSLDFSVNDDSRLSTEVEFHTRTLWYKKRDRFYEPLSGRTETWRLEMRTESGNPEILETLDLGVYTTTTALGEPNGNDSKWYICR